MIKIKFARGPQLFELFTLERSNLENMSGVSRQWGAEGASAPLLPIGGTRAALAPAGSAKIAATGGTCGCERPAAPAENPCPQIVEAAHHQEMEVPGPSVLTRPAANPAGPGDQGGLGRPPLY